MEADSPKILCGETRPYGRADRIEWADFVALALGEADPWSWGRPQTSAFRVRHTESCTSGMEDLYFIDG
jgi:hypothetical protein